MKDKTAIAKCLFVTLSFAVLYGCARKIDPPILTDEFDTVLVTKETQINEVVGQIEPVFPNSKKITWSLVSPVPGGDRRNYLREGQLDATEIVEIDVNSGELRLKSHPAEYPAHYYAEVRATNEDGFMEQVLIVIALENQPTKEHALDIFTQRIQTTGLGFYATETVAREKIEHAANVADALLLKDRNGSGKVTEFLKEKNAIMTIFKSFEERNTAIGYYMFARDFNSQDLQDEEIIPDYVPLGGPVDMRRDASIEEITHLIHGGGIMEAYPEVQERLEKATQSAIVRKFFRPWDGLPAASFSHEYLTIGLEIYYGSRQHRSYMGRIKNRDGSPRQPAFRLSVNNDVPLTAENLKKHDRELYEVVAFLFPTRDEFFAEMGWDTRSALN